MAYRRSITARSNLFHHHRFSPSISHSHRHHDVSQNSEASPISRNPQVRNYIQHRFLGAGNNFSNYRRFAVPAGCGMVSSRNYSSEADKTGVVKEVVGALELEHWCSPPVYGFPPEWAAAIDSLPPMVAFQHLIDYVHCFTGFNWWASIAATTIIARFLMLPLDIHRSKSKAKYSLAEPHWDAIEKELSEKKVSFDEYWVKREALIKEYGASPLQYLKGRLISVPVHCSIFLAVLNMAVNDPSFKDGGGLLFTDLTVGDLKLLCLTFYIINLLIEEIKPKVSEREMVVRLGLNACALTLLIVPKAAYFLWTTSALFSLAYEIAIKNSVVKKLLGIPIVPVELTSTNQKSKEG